MAYDLPITFTNSRDRFMGRTVNRKRRAFTGAGQQWMIEMTLHDDGAGSNMLGAKIMAHQALHGTAGKFSLALPQQLGIDVIDDTITLSEKADAGSTSIKVAKTSTGVLEIPAGYVFTLAGDEKVYMVMEDVRFANRAARPVVKIEPGLLKDAASGAALDLDPEIMVRWGEQTEWGVTYDGDSMVSYRAYFDEAI